MRQKSNPPPASSETLVRNIRRATRKHHAAEEKIRIVLDGLRGETSIAEIARREGIAESMYYSWSKEFLEAGKRRLAGDTARAEPKAPLRGNGIFRSETKRPKRPWRFKDAGGETKPTRRTPSCKRWLNTGRRP